MGIKKKRGSLYLLLVPRSEALALPIEVERATQKPTPNMLQYLAVHTTMANIHIPHRTSTVASSLALIFEFARFQNVKNKALSKRLSLCHVFPAMHPPPFGSRLLPKNNRKYTHNFTSKPIFAAFFHQKAFKNLIPPISYHKI